MSSTSDSWCLLLDTSLAGIGMGLTKMSRPEAKTPLVAWSQVDPEPQAAARRIDGLFAEAQQFAGGLPGYMLVGHGPGSFTGIKIGLAFTHGLLAASAIKVLGVSALAAAASAHFEEVSGSAALYLRATKTHGFVSRRTEAEPLWQDFLLEASAEGLQGVFQGSENIAQNSTIVSDWPVLEHALGSRSGSRISRQTSVELALTGMAAMARRSERDSFMQQPPEPHYLRLSTAEEQLGREVRGSKKARMPGQEP